MRFCAIDLYRKKKKSSVVPSSLTDSIDELYDVLAERPLDDKIEAAHIAELINRFLGECSKKGATSS